MQPIHCERKKNSHRINAGELHANVDHCNGDELPADATVCEQLTNGNGLDGGQRAQLLLHLLHLRLDVALIAVPLQGCDSRGTKSDRGHTVLTVVKQADSNRTY